MSAGSLARRYARALMQLGEDQGNLERLGREVADLASTIDSSQELKVCMSSPVFPRSDREKVIKAILLRLGASKTTTNFTMLLLDRERMAFVGDISRELGAMIDEKIGRVAALITSAKALSPMQESEIVKNLESLSGKKIQLSKKEDPTILGGVVAQVGDLVYDGSLRTQLERVRQSLA